MDEEQFLTFEDFFDKLSDDDKKSYSLIFESRFYVLYPNFDSELLLGLKCKANEEIYWLNPDINYKPFVKIDDIVYKITLNGQEKILEPI
jgi:hypothetical protein